jgi:hypothetical protein
METCPILLPAYPQPCTDSVAGALLNPCIELVLALAEELAKEGFSLGLLPGS